jgi:hypothetical protein
MEDFLAGTNQWSYCEFLPGYGFPGGCGASDSSYDQSSEFLPTCPSSEYSPQSEVYWFLYDPDFLGEKYDLGWLPTEMTQGLPFLFTSAEGVVLEHVQFSGTGSDGGYALSIERPSFIPYKNVFILDGMGNGVSIRGSGSYFFEDLSVTSDAAIWVWGNAVYIAEKANVSIDGLFVSTGHSGNAIDVEGDQVSVSLLNCQIEPRSYYQRAIYVGYVESMEIENFIYSYTYVDGYPQYYYPVEVYTVTNAFSMKNSMINCSLLISNIYAMSIYGYYHPASIAIMNVSLTANLVIGGFVYIYQGGGTVIFEDNNLLGGGVVNDAINIYGDCVVLDGNEMSNVTSQGKLWVIHGTSNMTAINNTITDATAQYSVYEIDGSWIYFSGNKMVSVEGHTAIEIGSDVDQLELTRNALIDVTVEFYIKTNQLYDYSTDGIIRIGPNFWSTTSFHELHRGTYDSTYYAALVTLEFESIFSDSEMTQIILSPPSVPILDLENMRLDGMLSSGETVVVPRGLYYAASSIILSHPEAQLILEPGVRLMFAEYASIRVDRGILKVLGEMDDPVLLAPTQNLTVEYGKLDIENSTVFDGIYFGPNSIGTIFGEGNQYIDGSILRHCYVKFGASVTNSASLYLDQVSVMLEKVTIMGDWSRTAYGVCVYAPVDALVFTGVCIQNAGYDGLYISYAYGGIFLSDIDIRGCLYNGLTIHFYGSAYVRGSTFDGNGGDQVYSVSGKISVCCFLQSSL